MTKPHRLLKCSSLLLDGSFAASAPYSSPVWLWSATKLLITIPGPLIKEGVLMQYTGDVQYVRPYLLIVCLPHLERRFVQNNIDHLYVWRYTVGQSQNHGHSRKTGHRVLMPPPDLVHDEPQVGAVVVGGHHLQHEVFAIWGHLPAVGKSRPKGVRNTRRFSINRVATLHGRLKSKCRSPFLAGRMKPEIL